MTPHRHTSGWGRVAVLLLCATLGAGLGHAGAADPVPPDATLRSLQPAALPIVQGASGIVTVQLGAAPAADTPVLLHTSDARIVGLPPAEAVVVPAGVAEQAFAVYGVSPGRAILTATLHGTSVQTVVTVTIAPPALGSLRPPVLPLTAGSTGTLTITLTASQPTATDVALTTSDPTVVGLPGDRVTIPAGSLAVPVPVVGRAPGIATVTAALPGTAATAAVTVEPPPPTVAAFACPATVAEGATGACTLTLNATQATETVVALVSAPVGIVEAPVTVTVPAGAVAIAVPVTALVPGTVTLTAGPLHWTTQAATVEVLPPPPTVASLRPSETRLGIGAPVTLALTLNAAQPTDTMVPLAAVPAGIVAAPPAVTVPAGALGVDVVLLGLAPGRATLTAGPVQGTVVQARLLVSPEAPTVTALTPPAQSLPRGTAAPLTVTIGPAQPDATAVPLTSSDPGTVEVPPSVPVPAGETSAPVPVVARAVGEAVVTAGPVGGVARQATVTVRPPELRALVVTPTTAGLVVGQIQPCTATGTLTDGTTQDVTGAVTWSSSDPATVGIDPDGRATGLHPGSATIRATLDTLSATAVLTVTATTTRGTDPTATSAASPADPLAAAEIGLTAAPAQVATVAGGEATVVVGIGSPAELTGPVRLAVAGLPAGATALISPQTLGPNQTGTLTIQTTPSTPAGVYPLVLTGQARSRGRAVVAEQVLTLTVLAGGQTVLTGRILDTHRRPIRGATIQLLTGNRTVETTTDAAGSFLLQDVPPGEHLVLVDGHPASHAAAKYPTIPITVTLRPGVVNRLPFTPHLHAQKDRNFTALHPTRETVATDPEVPGVALRIPAGAKIIGWDGQPNTKVSIHTVPIDRLPVAPVPAEAGGGTVYMFYFGKRGGGTASQPIPFEAPNDLGLRPGVKATLWFFDESHLPGVGPNAWRIAGPGTVTTDGRLIRTDPGIGIPKFCCGAAKWGPSRTDPKVTGPTPWPCQGTCGGEGVDLASGTFLHSVTDATLPGVSPIGLSRTYRSGESWPGPFGIGTTLAYDEYLQLTSPDVRTYVGAGNATAAFLKQPDGSFINTTIPTFRGARITLDPETARHTLRYKDGRSVLFGADPLPIQVRDRAGNTIQIARDFETNPTHLTDPAGRSLTLGWLWMIRDRVSMATDPLGRTVTYGYDTSNRLNSVTNPNGGITQYVYDLQHRMTSITDPRNIVTLQNAYDANSRVCTQTRADGGVLRFFYITTDRATLPESLQLLAEAAAGGPITQTPCSTVTATSAPVAATVLVDPRGHPTTSRFNGQGYLLQRTDALGQTTTYTREAGTNLLLSITDPLNRVTAFQYDANGNVTQLTDAANQVWTTTYEATYSQVTSLTDPLGNLTTFEYDAAGNLTAITSPEENLKPEPQRLKTRMTYNSRGQVLTVTDPLDHTTTYTYTAQGDLATVTDPLGHTTTRTYDEVSRLVTQTDPQGRLTWYLYDGLNRLTTIVDPLQGVTTFTYDATGNLLTVTDPREQTTTHTYDGLHRLATRTDPLTRTESFSYDLAGNLQTVTDRKSQVTTQSYDALNRRTQATYADSTVATFTYDAGSRLTQVDDTADPHRPIAFTYDPLDRLLTEITSLGTVTYTYDTAGRRTSMTVAGQTPVTYTHDANARLRTITQAPLTPVDIQYDAANRRTLLTLPNGVSDRVSVRSCLPADGAALPEWARPPRRTDVSV